MDNSSTNSEQKLPILKYQRFVPNLKNQRATQSQPKLQNSKYKGIYTVNESLKDEYVLKNLDLALGSLPYFIDLKTNDPNPILPNLRLNKRHRRKNEPKDDQGELFLKKANNILQEKNPFEILKTVDDEKTRGAAAKQIVSQIFKRIYGDDVDKFEEKNSKEMLQQIYIEGIDYDDPKIHFIKKNIKKNMEERFDLFIKQLDQTRKQKNLLKLKVEPTQVKTSIKESGNSKLNFDQIEESDERSQENVSIDKSRFNDNIMIPKVLESNQPNYVQKTSKLSFFGNNFTKLFQDEPTQLAEIRQQKQKRLDSIMKLKSRFADVSNLWNLYWKDSGVNPNSTDIDEYLEAQKNLHPQIKSFFIAHENSMDRNIHNLQMLNFDQDDLQSIKAEKQEIVIIDTNKQFILRNIDIVDEVIPWLLLSTQNWGNLTRIEFYNTKLSDASLKLLINTFQDECQHIQQIVLSYNKLNSQSTPVIAKLLKSQSELKILQMTGMEMGSKDFTQICLAICEGVMTTINFSHNLIDKRGLKPLETLLRYVKSLESVDMSENNLTDGSEEEKTKLFRQLRKIVIYNEGLKNKNIKI